MASDGLRLGAVAGTNVFCSDGAVPIDNNVSEREMNGIGRLSRLMQLATLRVSKVFPMVFKYSEWHLVGKVIAMDALNTVQEFLDGCFFNWR
jgi:hypothetical protein